MGKEFGEELVGSTVQGLTKLQSWCWPAQVSSEALLPSSDGHWQNWFPWRTSRPVGTHLFDALSSNGSSDWVSPIKTGF